VSYPALVARIWNGSVKGSPFFVWEEKLRKLKVALRLWAKTLSNPAVDRQAAQRQLENHQIQMEGSDITQEILQQEVKLQKNWHQACREEEKYWHQKSRCLWLEVGDKNTKFFHKQAEARKQFQKVTEIHTQGQTITDFEGIKRAVVQTFETLYTETQDVAIDPSSYPLNLIPKCIQEDVNNKLITEVDQQEIKEALDQLHPDKAPGPDGFTARFFHNSWDVIKSDLTKLIKKSQSCVRIGGGTNSSFLALIPKERGATSFDRFRPISLCNTSYKILTKIIANRLKNILPAIIPENQGGFIKGRHIMDNIILVQEALHSSIR
jgi:hypothetical protein